MHLVDNNKPKIAEKLQTGAAFTDQQGFQRLRRNLQNSLRMLQKAVFVRSGRIPVPFANGQSGLLQQIFQSFELIVDQCLQRTDIQNADRSGRLPVQLRQNGQKSGLCFSRGGSRGKQQIVVAVKDNAAGGNLDVAQLRPSAGINIILDIRR